MNRQTQLPTITPRQMQMARGAARMSMAELGELIGVSKQAVSLYEKGDDTRICDWKLSIARQEFEEIYIYFGPNDGVCYGVDRFKEDSEMIHGLMKALGDAGLMPASDELIRYVKEARRI